MTGKLAKYLGALTFLVGLSGNADYMFYCGLASILAVTFVAIDEVQK